MTAPDRLRRGGRLAKSILGLTCAAAAMAQEWPQYRGPAGSGIAAEPSNPPLEFGPRKNMKWKTALPPGHSSPAIWGGRIFLTGFDKQAGKLEVFGIDRASGKILWRRAVAAKAFEEVHPLSSLATATPATDGERVYAYFGSFGIACFDVDGNPQWTVPLPVARIIPYGSGTSLVLAGENAILNRDEVPDSYLMAVDRRTGKIAWKVKQYDGEMETRTGSKATPVAWKDEIVLHRRGEIVGYDAASGARKWWVKADTQGAGTPVASADTIFAATWFNTGEPGLVVPLPDFDSLLKQYDKDGDGVLSAGEFPARLYIARRVGLAGVEGADNSQPGARAFAAADSSKDGKLDRSEWEAYLRRQAPETRQHGLLAIKPGGHGDVTATHVPWKEPRGVPEVPSPLYYKGRVYMVAGGIVTCLDAIGGKVVYRGRVSAGAYFASPIEAGGRIFLASHEGAITTIGGGDKLEILARNDLGESIFATPAILGDMIYVRTAAALYAFGK